MVQQDKGTVDVDQANVETAQLNLDYSHVTAPISGRAGTLLVDLGNLVGLPGAQTTTSATTTSSATGGQGAIGTTMVTIAQIQPIYVSFNVPQTRLSEIQRAQPMWDLALEKNRKIILSFGKPLSEMSVCGPKWTLKCH